MRINHDTYWALLPPEELSERLSEKRTDYYRHARETGRLDLWRRAVSMFRGYADGVSAETISFGGEQGELAQVNLNHFGGIAQSLHTLVSAAKPTTRTIASTSGVDGVDQAVLGTKILDYERPRLKLHRLAKQALTNAIISGEGWLVILWDRFKGRIQGATVDPETGEQQLVYEGDNALYPLHPMDVWRDPEVDLSANLEWDWVGFRLKVNRWEYAARYPQFRDEVLSAPGEQRGGDEDELFYTADGSEGSESDYCYLQAWYHKQSVALPAGRYVFQFGDTIVEDGPYERDVLPIKHFAPDYQEKTCFGWTPMWDLMGAQMGINSTVSAAQTNHEAHGVQLMWMNASDTYDVDALFEGAALLRSDTRPEPLQLTAISADSYKLPEMYQRYMELRSGVNSVMRGDPQSSLKSGNSLALVSSMGLQHNSNIQGGYAEFIQDVYNELLQNWKDYVEVERTAEVIGDDEQVAVERWSKETISDIVRYAVELSDPAFSTSQGKMEIADKFAERGWAGPMEWFQMLETGRLDPVEKGAISQQRLVLRENEMLRQGAVPPVLPGDDHPYHDHEHLSVLSDPRIRENEAVVEAVRQHMQMHQEFMQVPPPAPAGGPGQPPGQAPAGEGEGPESAPVPAVAAGINPAAASEADLPNMPSMPDGAPAMPGIPAPGAPVPPPGS